MKALEIARDWSIILLALEGIVFATIALLAAFYAQKGLGQALPKIEQFLKTARVQVASIRESVRLILRKIASPFAAIRSVKCAIKTFLRVLIGRYN